MKTTSQVAKLTGVSVRTLQYYDEIGLLKPSEITSSGYRLYDRSALERLQQILFFRELDFKLKDIKEILENPDFDKKTAYAQQKKLLTLKRTRLDDLISLLEKLEKGEQSMSFKEFGLGEYLEALEQFKADNGSQVVKYWGSMENFDTFIQKVREDESQLTRLAVEQFGSVEKYTRAMKSNLEHFSSLMAQAEKMKENIDEIMEQNNRLYEELTSDMTRSVSCPDVQNVVEKIVELVKESSKGMDMGEGYWNMVIDSYTNETVIDVTDKKYGAGASSYIASALSCYLHRS